MRFSLAKYIYPHWLLVAFVVYSICLILFCLVSSSDNYLVYFFINCILL